MAGADHRRTDREAAQAELVRALFEDGWNDQRFGFLDGATVGAIPFHYNGQTLLQTAEDLPGLVAAWREAFDDLHAEVRHLVVEGDLVAASIAFSGVHRGEWMGIPPSGSAFEVEETMFFRFEDGLLAEMWEVFDDAGLARQLGG